MKQDFYEAIFFVLMFGIQSMMYSYKQYCIPVDPYSEYPRSGTTALGSICCLLLVIGALVVFAVREEGNISLTKYRARGSRERF